MGGGHKAAFQISLEVFQILKCTNTSPQTLSMSPSDKCKHLQSVRSLNAGSYLLWAFSPSSGFLFHHSDAGADRAFPALLQQPHRITSHLGASKHRHS